MGREPDDLSPEQALMVAVLTVQGHDRDEALAIVRADRVASYLVGAHLAPTLQHLADRIAEAAALYRDALT